MKLKTILAAACAAVAALAAAGAAAQAPRNACVFYEHVNYEGRSLTLSPGQTIERLPLRWNDTISSFRMGQNCEVRVATDERFGGREGTADEDVTNVGARWNDQISAIGCQCDARRRANAGNETVIGGGAQANGNLGQRRRPPRVSKTGTACVLFDEAGYAGRWRGMEDGDFIPNFGPRFRNVASSARIARGCALVVDWGGPYKAYYEFDATRFNRRISNRVIGARCLCPTQTPTR